MTVRIENGFVNEKPAAGLDLVAEITRMKREKNAVILAHYYQDDAIQEIADFVGDSLGLSQQAAKTDADIIVFAGVHFMAETAKILSPNKKVLIPDLQAGCSLSDSCQPEAFAEFIRQHPNHVVISYVNTSAEVKALTDVVCTSSNAIAIVNSFPAEQKIIFGPDRNLGNYISKVLNREMVVWDGACMVHEEFSVEKLLALKNEHPDAKVLAHPECMKPILVLADYIGSTSQMIDFSVTDASKKFIVATESGILYQMRKESPQKSFIAAPPNDSTCACNNCAYMRLITLEKLYNTLKYELPEVTMDVELMDKARGSIVRMLELSKTIGK